MQYDFIDQNGNYDLLYTYVKNKSLRKVIDIGAWWGPWSLWWQDKAQHVEIFEPNQKIIPKLKNNIKMGNFFSGTSTTPQYVTNNDLDTKKYISNTVGDLTNYTKTYRSTIT